MDMSAAFQESINDFLIIVIAIAVILVLVVILGSKKSAFRRKFDELFVQETVGSGHKMEFNKEYYITGEKNMRLFSKTKSPTRTEMVTLVQKVDERRRTLDPSGTSKLYNEYYELIFRTRKGEILHIVTTKTVYKEVPFNQTGSLTFKGEQFLKFKFLGGEITEKYSNFNTGSVKV